MKLKFVVATAMLAASFGASATTYTFGDLDPTGDQSGGLSNKIAKGAFSDMWTFVLSAPESTALGAQQSFTTTAGQITGLKGELFEGTVDLGALTYSEASNNAQQNLAWNGILGAGSYYIKIDGIAGVKNTTYTTTLSITPVPEPETYGMLLVGLGLLGFTARRKSNPKLG